MQDERFESQFVRMRDAGRYQVSEEDPNPTGWTVVASDGVAIGEVRDLIVDPSVMKVRYFEVEAEDSWRLEDPRVLVDAREADLNEDDRRVILHGLLSSAVTTLPPAQTLLSSSVVEPAVAHDRGAMDRDFTTDRTDFTTDRTDDEPARLTRAEEELRIGKREVEAGEMVVNKTVETEHVHEPVERRVERVRVERRPVTNARTSDVEIHEDQIRVPIVEEEVVVEKRPVVKEEIVLTREADVETEVVDEEVRKERVDVKEEGTRGTRGGRDGRH